MKISNNFLGIKMSAAGMSIQKKKMNLISENIANVDTTKTETGDVYKRKFLVIKQENSSFNKNLELQNNTLMLSTTDSAHFSSGPHIQQNPPEKELGLTDETKQDVKTGDLVYMPDHPDANSSGYVQMPNVNIITEMVDMIAATRSYEANLTSLNSAKQIAKDSLEI
jgi:flagellar basal-body rod protein FlgC